MENIEKAENKMLYTIYYTMEKAKNTQNKNTILHYTTLCKKQQKMFDFPLQSDPRNLEGTGATLGGMLGGAAAPLPEKLSASRCSNSSCGVREGQAIYIYK
jgi:hypothetical protein